MEKTQFEIAKFADWQLKGQSDPFALDLHYWCDVLDGAPPFIDLPSDDARPVEPALYGGVHAGFIDADLTAEIRRLGFGQGATPFMTFLAAFLVLVHRFTNQSDLVIGTPVPGRNHVGTEALDGTVVHLLPVRARLERGQSFIDALLSVRSTVLGMQAHQQAPFERIVEAACRERYPGRHPIFNVVFNFDGVPVAASWPGDVKAEFDVSPFDLTLSLRPMAGGGMSCEFEYSSDLFESETIARLAGQYVMLLQGIVADPACTVGRLPLLGPAERAMLLDQWSAPVPAAAPAEHCVHELFEHQAALTPDRDALVCGHERLTYAQLNRRANRLAWALRSVGVGPECLVAICLNRCVELPIAILAVLKAGGAYVPLDPLYPPLRLSYMLEVARPVVLLTQRNLAGRFTPEPDRVLMCVDDPSWAPSNRDDNPPTVVSVANLAYVIFTSGSTGRPKGVAIEHRGPAALVEWARQTFDVDESAGMLFSTSASFDVSVFELLTPLTRGSKIIMVPNVLELPNAPAKQEVTFISTVPSAMTELIRMGGVPSSTRAIALAGEAVPAALAQACHELPHVRAVYNIYGPTEDTVYSTLHRIPKRSTTAPAIGRPITGTRAYVLDSDLQPVPIGSTGELYLGGSKLARGYLHRDDLTQERFIANSFRNGEKMYRTGDLCRWNNDGSIQYLGRIDQQVKLRGHRIELGEIESVLGAHAAVAQCRVVVRGAGSEQRLIAYVVPRADPPPALETLRSHLGGNLPGYMIPSAFLFLERMPLTPNGKIDTAALPEPGPSVAGPAFGSLQGEIQMQLGKIWCEVLGLDRVGPADNFFDLGGNSLLAVRLAHQVNSRMGLKVPLSALFLAPTVARFAEMLSEQAVAGSKSGSTEPVIVPLRVEGKRRPLFYIPAYGDHPFKFYSLLSLLDKDQPAYGLQFQGLEAEAITRVEVSAALFLAQIRLLQPNGPYRLLALSGGSIVAFEMAQQLLAQQQKVELLAFFDGFAPGALQPRPRWQKLLVHGRQLLRRGLPGAMRYTIDRVKGVSRSSPIIRETDGAEQRATDEFAAIHAVGRAACDRYQGRHYPGTVSLLRAVQREPFDFLIDDPANGWAPFADRVQVYPVPGTHWTMFDKPHLPAIADGLNRFLRDLPEP